MQDFGNFHRSVNIRIVGRFDEHERQKEIQNPSLTILAFFNICYIYLSNATV